MIFSKTKFSAVLSTTRKITLSVNSWLRPCIMMALYNLLMIMMGIKLIGFLVHVVLDLSVFMLSKLITFSLSQAINFVKSERIITKLLFCSRRMNIRFVIMSDNVLLGLMVLCPQVHSEKVMVMASRNKTD